MAYNGENEITGPIAEMANKVLGVIAQLLGSTITALKDPGHKVSLLAGSAIPSLAGLATVLSHPDINKECIVNADELTFASCYIIATAEDHTQGIVMGFSPETVDKALTLFKTIMGREYTNIAPAVRALILDQKIKAANATPVHLKNFMPH
jgi:hypothetical protein